MKLAIDFETAKMPRHLPWAPGSFPVCLGAYREDGERTVKWFNHEILVPPPLPEVKKSIEYMLSEADLIIAHNLKFELVWLYELGFRELIEKSKVWCTQVAEYMLLGQLGDHPEKKGMLKLSSLAERYGLPVKLDRVAAYWEADYETDEIPHHVLTEYVLRDCEIAMLVARQQIKRMGQLGLLPLASIHMEQTKYLADCEYNGALLDRSKLELFSSDFDQRLKDVEAELSELLPGIEISSNDQLSAGLYGGTIIREGKEIVCKPRKDGSIREYERKAKVEDKIKGLGLVPPKGSETKKAGYYKTDSDTLASLHPKTPEQKRTLKLIEEWRNLTKQKGTYFDGLLEHIGEDDFIHPSMMQTVTATGRLSCRQPNLQNQSRAGTSPVKQAFISRYSD